MMMMMMMMIMMIMTMKDDELAAHEKFKSPHLQKIL